MFKPIVTDPVRFGEQLTKHSNNGLLAQEIRDEARGSLLANKAAELLDHKDLDDLWCALEKYKDASVDKPNDFITYPNFLKAKGEVCPKARKYFTAPIFAKLCHAERLSRVNIDDFFNYVSKIVWLQETRIGISTYDARGDGYLRDGELESYVSDLIPSLSHVNEVGDAFRPFYLCTVVRKFFFFLDPLRVGRIRICDILACGFLDKILELREASTTQARLEENWFSLESAKLVYAGFLQLDTDGNGMLSREELAGYNHGSLTDAFLDRVFQECLTFGGEMDYKVYLDFVLAMENRKEPQSITYLFRIIDLNGNGRLCVKTLEYFTNSLLELLGDEPDTPRACDVVAEIFDMVQPKHPDYITLDDLLKSGNGEIVLGILTDIQCFMLHENSDI